MGFTAVLKNEILGINLLMEQQFKNLHIKIKALKEQKDPLFKSFEGALFNDSAWFFHFQKDHITLVENNAVEPKVTDRTFLTEVLFVGDNFKGEGEDLLGKMISAMKLSKEQFYRFPIEDELENIVDLEKNLECPTLATQKLLDLILEKQPRVIVSLGATVTNVLLGRREKLSTIHGQFFKKQIKHCVCDVMPIFHPDFLLINPNMKRTAWIDLQKVLEYLGKI